jgi:excisionase family DNA binding protein
MSAATATVDPADELLAEGALEVPEASIFSGLTRTNLYEHMQRGELPFVKIGKRRLIPKRALVELLKKGLVMAGAGA